jgi:uncharacterized protein YbjT (DUF2867 family)
MGELHGVRVLVAGGTGNVGRHLVRAQLEAGATVLVPTRSREKLEALLGTLVTGMDIGRYVAYLLSNAGAGLRGETIDLRSVEVARAIAG